MGAGAKLRAVGFIKSRQASTRKGCHSDENTLNSIMRNVCGTVAWNDFFNAVEDVQYFYADI
jgi:hypothetical protein